MYEVTEMERHHEATLRQVSDRMNNKLRPNLGSK